eukprot:TRINITY_DN24610_c0_g1_i1.p1 TRINITY_DN24610_c0_g1~~TRINITY_DN24610_c0_g1_i1.p1  ORF type:complete len:459 (+),score=71.68 TRINITY_DN24610_c0_g1_i1:168-1379(+)
MGFPKDWDAFKQNYCCQNPPYICAPYDRGCDSPCLYMNATVSCRARMHFKRQWAFQGQGDACLWAYWLVMDQCPVCHECTALQAGCTHNTWDCTGDPDKEQWGSELREFCCLKQGKACTEIPKFASSNGFPEVPFDCQDHHWDWQVSWSHEQREWCCTHQKIGCQDLQGKAPKIEEAVSDADFQIILAARDAAGNDAGSAVVPSTTTQTTTGAANHSKQFDCGSPATSFLAVYWPEHKKQWCCEHENISCDRSADSQKPAKPASAQPYDCNAGTKTGHESWSKEKKDWCCQHMVIGCDSAEHSKPSAEAIEADLYGSGDAYTGGYDCTVEVNNWRTSWSDGQKKACCKKSGVGCESKDSAQEPQAKSDSEPDEETDGFFDCSKGGPDQWSDQKKEVCGVYQMQ